MTIKGRIKGQCYLIIPPTNSHCVCVKLLLNCFNLNKVLQDKQEIFVSFDFENFHYQLIRARDGYNINTKKTVIIQFNSIKFFIKDIIIIH